MLNLIKADLYRISRPRGLRGSLWQYTLVFLAIYALFVGIYFLLRSPLLGMPADDIAALVNITFATPTAAVMNIGGSLVPLCTVFMAAELALADFKNGFIKTLLTARQGRLSFIAARILTAGIISAIVIVMSCVLTAISCLLLGATFTHSDTLLSALVWFTGLWLNTWAMAVLTLAVVYLVRVGPIAYGAGFCFYASLVPEALMLGSYAVSLFLPGFDAGVTALETLAAWMPSTAIGGLADGGSFLNAGTSVWGSYANALTIDPTAQILLTGVIWIALGSIVALAAARKRDV